MKKIIFTLIASAFFMAGCKKEMGETTKSGLKKENFRMTIDGKQTELYVLKNAQMEVCVTNFGARVVSIMVPDKKGEMRDVVLGFDSIQDYKNIPNNFGAAIGRYGNRIGKGKFTLDGVEYTLAINNFGHSLHGGLKGFQDVMFDAVQPNDSTLELKYLSKDGEEGYPGNLDCKITYSLTKENGLSIGYEATTDKPTIVNLTNHTYFNLDGDASTTNADWLLTIHASNYTPIDSTFMTSGEIVAVKVSDMDFSQPTRIGERIDNFSFVQLKNGMGYDHNYVLDTHGDISKMAARMQSLKTGIVLDVYTTEPGLQFYAGNFLDGTVKGKKGIAYPKRSAVCLETQKYPDTPNKPLWPSCVLHPGKKYTTKTIYKFSVKN